MTILDRPGRTARRKPGLHGTDLAYVPLLSAVDYHRACGARLRTLIGVLGITQAEAARLMGVSRHVLRNWLVGENPVQSYPLYRFCRAKEINPLWVYWGDTARLPHEVALALEEVQQEQLARVLQDAAVAGHSANEMACGD